MREMKTLMPTYVPLIISTSMTLGANARQMSLVPLQSPSSAFILHIIITGLPILRLLANEAACLQVSNCSGTLLDKVCHPSVQQRQHFCIGEASFTNTMETFNSVLIYLVSIVGTETAQPPGTWTCRPTASLDSVSAAAASTAVSQLQPMGGYHIPL